MDGESIKRKTSIGKVVILGLCNYPLTSPHSDSDSSAGCLQARELPLQILWLSVTTNWQELFG